MERDSNNTFLDLLDETKVIQYFIDVKNNLVKNVDHLSENLLTLCKCLDFLETNNFLSCNFFIFNEAVKNNLSEVLSILCDKYLLPYLNGFFDLEIDVFSDLCDCVVQTLKIRSQFDSKFVSKGIETSFIVYFKSCNKLDTTHCNEVVNSHSIIIKLFVKILKNMNKENVWHLITSNNSDLLKSFPVSDYYSLNTLVNIILPDLIRILNSEKHLYVLEFVWQKIYSCYLDDFSENKHQIYTLLCFLAECLYKDNLVELHIHENVTFWNIVQCGLIDNVSPYRKKSIYVLRIFLFWIKTHNKLFFEEKSSLFYVKTSEDFLMWSEFVSLFEILEEKQVHIIKPVLPKFEKILEHFFKQSQSSDCYLGLHPSWIVYFIKRMLIHESKFVAKEGLSLAMNLDFKKYQITRMNSEYFIQVVIEALNDQSMFTRMKEKDGLSLFFSSDKISAFLSIYISALDSDKVKKFMRELLKIMSSQIWCPVALLHLSFSLTKMNSYPSWEKEDILHLRNIVEGCLKNQELIFRNAVEHWLLLSSVNFFDWNSIHFDDIMELLFLFKSFNHTSPLWNVIINKLKGIVDSENYEFLSVSEAKAFCIKCMECICSGSKIHEEVYLMKCNKVMLVLFDIFHENPSINWSNLLHPVNAVLKNACSRPYQSKEKLYNVLHFCALVNNPREGYENKLGDLNISELIFKSYSNEMVEFLYNESFITFKGSGDILKYDILSKILLKLTCMVHLKSKFLILWSNLMEKNTIFHGTYSTISANAMILCTSYYHDLVNADENNESAVEFHFSVLKCIIEKGIVADLLRSVTIIQEGKGLWLKVLSHLLKNFINFLNEVIDLISVEKFKTIFCDIVVIIQDIFNVGPTVALISTIRCVSNIISKLTIENVSYIQDLLNLSWKACQEFRRSESFKPAINALILAVYQPYMLQKECFDILYQFNGYFEDLSESVLGVFYLMIKQFCISFPLIHLLENNFNCIPLFISAITFGPVHHKNQKIVEDTIEHLRNCDKEYSTFLEDYDKSGIFVRAVVISYLLENLNQNYTEKEEFVTQLINKLLEFDSRTLISKSCKFSNSLNHRIRNRIWQTVLILQPHVTCQNNKETLFRRVLQLLECESQQISVRYLQEWIIFKIIFHDNVFCSEFVAVFETIMSKRPGVIVSFLSIFIHLILHTDLITCDYVHRCIPLLLNCCMAQNFLVRLYGRLAMTKLFKFCEIKMHFLLSKYECIYKLSLESISDKGNTHKNLLKLSNDFYFSTFNPVNHYTLETIFLDLPRLSNLASEEWIKPSAFEIQECSKNLSISVLNSDDSLKTSICSSWSNKNLGEHFEDIDSVDYNFQKKICPSRPENSSERSEISKLLLTPKEGLNGLVVIASLIDRLPNLGGICRTCEIFGVEELTISSLKYLEDKQFQNLAVSANKWLSIKEIKLYHLKEYLLDLKEHDYTLVGAEQTGNSHKLTEFAFPKKTALVLGNEKEGIPVDIIQLLDTCIEVPQQGVIRSLNVHVCGAIFIWEYVRQHLKNSE